MFATSLAAHAAIGVDILTGDDFESLLTVNGDLYSLLWNLRQLVKLQQSWNESSLCAHFRKAIVAACTQQRTDPTKVFLQFYQHSGRDYCCFHTGIHSDRGQPIYGYFSFDDTKMDRLFLDHKHHFTDEPQIRLGLQDNQLPVVADFSAVVSGTSRILAPVNDSSCMPLSAAHNGHAVLRPMDEPEGIVFLEGVKEMAELVVSRALRRAEKVSSAPGAAVGVHTMELVKKSKRKSQPKLWRKQEQNVLIADSRVTLDRNSQMWIAATSLGATATTNIPSIPSTSPTWATEVSDSIVEQILKDPRGQPGHISLVKQLSKQHAKDMTPQAWKRAVVSAMRKDALIRIEKKQVFPADRPNGGISSSSALSAGIKAKTTSVGPSHGVQVPSVSIVTHDALEDAPTYAQIVRTQFPLAHDSEFDDSDSDLDEWEDVRKHDRSMSSAVSVMTAPSRLVHERVMAPVGAVARPFTSDFSSALHPIASSRRLEEATASRRSSSRSVQIDNDWSCSLLHVRLGLLLNRVCPWVTNSPPGNSVMRRCWGRCPIAQRWRRALGFVVRFTLMQVLWSPCTSTPMSPSVYAPLACKDRASRTRWVSYWKVVCFHVSGQQINRSYASSAR